jgi:hypothetical protein
VVKARLLRRAVTATSASLRYVEDNDDNVYMLRNRLLRAGFTVIIATDTAALVCPSDF